MADVFSFKLEGLQALQDRLSQMEDEMAAKNIVSAAWSANKLMVDQAKDKITSNGSVQSGLLRGSIKRKRIVYDSEGRVVIITGVGKDAKGTYQGKPRVPWRYAAIVEKEKPFMQPAFDQAKQAVIDEFQVALLQKIKKFEKS